MADGDNMCCQCEITVSESCNYCANIKVTQKIGDHKIYPSDSTNETPSSNFINERFDGRCLQAVSVRHSSGRSDEDEADDSAKNFFSPYSLDTSDIDSSSVSTRHEFNSFMSLNSSPSDSPSKIQEHMAVLKSHEHVVGPEYSQSYDDFSIFQEQCEKSHSHSHKPLDFETNDFIWFPPPPHDQNDDDDDDDTNFFSYGDDDDEMGDTNTSVGFSSSGHKEPLKTVVQGHFRALVSQLLQSEFNSTEKWLDIVTSLAWEAAHYVKPDTSRGGSMDPGDYVKIKCIASGNPSDSLFVKGVVCTKNIKHKRMTSEYKNARLLILGGALEYQRSRDQLSSIETLLQQEMDHLKMIVSRIEALRPNVLLVEKSVSSYAQEYLLAKEISLVLNIKRPLLDRISRCTGASITPSISHISTTRVGQCELFTLEKVLEEHENPNQFNKKPSKTLMFFEGCARRLGCTVLLKGSSREELKKLKHVVQYAIFAAYHLSLETSFLADEGASLPKMTIMPLVPQPEMTNPEMTITPAGLEVSESDVAVESRKFFASMDDKDVERVCDLMQNDECDKDVERGEVIIEGSEEYYSATDNNQSILVSFSSHCVLNGSVCERSRLLRIKFYGCFDKPLGRYLQDDLFDQASLCQSCKEPSEAHVKCYTHQQGNLTINVRRLQSLKLPGGKDGKIWMWHRCLRCTHVDGVPPANHRVVMSDAAWGLSLGKFLELSFSNHATANRVASCGHSLQRDCLRFYGMGDMVAFFRYSPIDILSVHLPPSVLQFGDHFQQDWLKKEVSELLNKIEALYDEILDVLNGIESKSTSFGNDLPDSDELSNHVMELKEQLSKERQEYIDLLQSADEENGAEIDVFELNRLRHSLVINLHFWDRRICSLNLYNRSSNLKPSSPDSKSWRSDSIPEDTTYHESELNQDSDSVPDSLSISFDLCKHEELQADIERISSSLERAPSAASVLSDKIDSAWAGPLKSHEPQTNQNPNNNPNSHLSRLPQSPTRVYSFDSAIRQQELNKKGLPPSSLYLSTLKSFHASGDYVHMVRDPVHNIQRRSYSQAFSNEDFSITSKQSLISSTSFLPEGARLMIPNGGQTNLVISVYDNEPTSIIAYALSSKEHDDWITDRVNLSRNGSTAWQSFVSVDLDYAYYAQEDAIGPLFSDRKSSNHVTIPFEHESGGDGKVKFSVTCYFAKNFDALRQKCCPNELDYVRSLSRCKRWSAQGGKSNVYFAKSLDERFIIKQVTKTELESFEEFAPEYFKYLMDSLNSGSPTCLAKIMGIYQVTVKHSRAGKEAKMNVLIMENVFFKRNISRVYDLKGSSRSRYNSDTTGTNKTLLDMNLLEALRTNPIFLGSKAKRKLERAVWNDTSFLASIDVIDYSLLVGVDEEKKELVLGIIDFMRQYTWDKHLETWVKASGILGGPKNAAPTIISPKQYKKRFRKAMTSYFLTVPDQWSS